MITNKLEDLILKGRAFFRTAVIGGTQKATINIDEDRFIIITDVTYFPGYYRLTDEMPNVKTDFASQFTIYGNRGYNNFVVRHKIELSSTGEYYVSNHIRFDLYILHTDQVGFSFCKAKDIAPTSFVAPANNPGYAPPLDYGREGDTGAINTSVTSPIVSPTNRLINNTTRAGSGSNNADTFILPIDSDTAILDTEIQYTNQYPILHVNYVEILGNPNNLGI